MKWIIFFGTKFKVNKCIIAVGADVESSLPIFGSLKEILLCGNLTFLLVSLLETHRFEENFIGYSVTETGTESIWPLDNILDYNIYKKIVTVEGLQVIPLKYDLFDIIDEHNKGSNPLHEK